ncbi:MAG: hypothetical protein V8S96_08815 [Lachnospiraceae bacterium]
MKEDEVLPDVLNKNLEAMRSISWTRDRWMISNAFLESGLFRCVSVPVLRTAPGAGQNFGSSEILYGIAYNYYKETAEYSVKIVEQLTREPYSIDFHVFSEDGYSRFCGRLTERMKVLDPVSDSVDDLCSRMMPSQRYMIGFVFCSFNAYARQLNA